MNMYVIIRVVVLFIFIFVSLFCKNQKKWLINKNIKAIAFNLR